MNKKITLLAFLLAGALCASAGIMSTTKKADKVVLRGNGVMPEVIKVQHKDICGIKAAAPGEVLTWDFESEDQVAEFTFIDHDGDGLNWEYVTEITTHSGVGCMSSASYDNPSYTALTPDNWMISPKVDLGGTLSLWATGQDASYAAEVFGVYVCSDDPSDVSNFVQVGSDITVTGTYTEYIFDLSEFEGQSGYFAIRHYNVTDMFRLNIDDITLNASGEAPAPPITIPTDVTVVPGATTAEVAWTSEEPAFNLRYREYFEPTGYLWDFEEEQAEDNALPAGWTTIDADGDGYAWYHLNIPGNNWACHSGAGHLTSASYLGGALTPDNWLISPKVNLTGELSFWAAGQDASWAEEVFAVYVSTGDPTDPSSFVAISDEITATNPIEQYVFDLSDYEGQEGYIAIRHFNVSDMFRLNIDDVMIGEPAEEPEWILVEDVNNPYIIEGLTPETMYEVQVQAVRPATRAAGSEEEVSDWTESTIFTTTEVSTGIETIKSEAQGDNNYYNLMGQKMNGSNLPAGIYIHNGKKVVVK